MVGKRDNGLGAVASAKADIVQIIALCKQELTRNSCQHHKTVSLKQVNSYAVPGITFL